MSKVQANCLLLLAAAFWGFGNVAQKTVLDHLDPLSAVGMRCLIAGLMAAPLMMLERGRKLGPDHIISLIKVSALFSISIAIQQVSYLGTSVTNASFLVSTATVMTPLAAWFLIGERPTAIIGLAAGMTLVGVLLLSGGLTATFSQGDLAAMLSAAFYALWMVELGRHGVVEPPRLDLRRDVARLLQHPEDLPGRVAHGPRERGLGKGESRGHEDGENRQTLHRDSH